MIRRIVMRDSVNDVWLSFSEPLRVLRARDPSEVLPLLGQLEESVNSEQLHACGYICYEAAAGIDRSLVTKAAGRMPLLEFALFRQPERFADLPPAAADVAAERQWLADTGRDAYRKAHRGKSEHHGCKHAEGGCGHGKACADSDAQCPDDCGDECGECPHKAASEAADDAGGCPHSQQPS